MSLAAPTTEAIEAIRRHAPDGVCEIGAGEGRWLEAMMRAGIPCIGYDIAPRGPLVAFGDHHSAARHHGLALLAVWPPDGPAFAGWCAAWLDRIVMACGDWARFDMGRADWQELEDVSVPAGPKGGSVLRIFRRGVT